MTRTLLALALLILPSAKLLAQNEPEPFAEEIAAFEAWDRRNAWPDAPVLFVGSSSIRMWPTVEAFPGLPVINRGFGGSQIAEVNHYLDRIVLKYRPRAIVFYAGDNDVASGKSAEQVAMDFRTFVRRVHEALPRTPVVFIAIKPSLARWNLWPEMQRANASIAALAAEDPYVAFADIAPPMLGPDGRPRPGFFLEDGLHLSEAGYAAWNRVVAATLEDVLPK